MIRIDPTPPKGNWEGAIVKLVGALSEAFGQQYIQAGKSTYDAVKAFRTTNETPEQRAWTLWRESLTLALEDFFKTANLYRRPSDPDEFNRLLQDILSKSAKIAQTEGTSLSEAHLETPTDFPLYRAFRDQLPDLANAVAPDHRQAADALRRRLDRSYRGGVPCRLDQRLGAFQSLGGVF